MKILLTAISILFFSLAASAVVALPSNTEYQDENQVKLQLQIFDQEGVSGEEFVMVKGSDGREPLMVKVEKPSEESLSGSVFVEDQNGHVLRDESLSLSFGSEYEQILKQLEDAAFKAGFVYLPEQKPANAVGFLMSIDNLTGEMRGYHLVPQVEPTDE